MAERLRVRLQFKKKAVSGLKQESFDAIYVGSNPTPSLLYKSSNTLNQTTFPGQFECFAEQKVRTPAFGPKCKAMVQQYRQGEQDPLRRQLEDTREILRRNRDDSCPIRSSFAEKRKRLKQQIFCYGMPEDLIGSH